MEHLFIVDSRQAIEPGGKAEVFVTPTHVPSVPMSVRLPVDVAESFVVRRITAGVEPLLWGSKAVGALAPAAAGRWLAAELNRPDALVPIVMERGMDFGIYVENIGAAALPFKCEVWGRLEVPEANWEHLPGPGLGSLRCKVCQHTTVLQLGSRIPYWCNMCVETLPSSSQGGS